MTERDRASSGGRVTTPGPSDSVVPPAADTSGGTTGVSLRPDGAAGDEGTGDRATVTPVTTTSSEDASEISMISAGAASVREAEDDDAARESEADSIARTKRVPDNPS